MIACRFCGQELDTVFADLGMSPLSNAFVRADALQQPETFYPLKAFVCEECFLVQLPQVATPAEIFSDYAYFSSFSDSWLEHARTYAEGITPRLGLNANSQVVEIASNDGYLLQFFMGLDIPVLGIEPAANVARVAIEKGISTEVRFFGAATARELVERGVRADLLIANNVLAHVPDLNDFVEGCRVLLADGGRITMEFPHLLRLIEGNEFDTIYHEHFSYFSIGTVARVFAAHSLAIVDVEMLSTHGGSVRIHAVHAPAEPSQAVTEVIERERQEGLFAIETYRRFGEAIFAVKRDLLSFLIQARTEGKRVAAYGAPAKGNTLLNFCGIRTDLLAFTVDRSPHKQGLYLPGTRLPIHAPDELTRFRPHYVLILPWNLKDEITVQMAHVREWGGQFVTAIPHLQVWP